MLFNWMKDRRIRKYAADGLYRKAVSQSRLPAFYREMAVPDTFDGRFDLLCLHISLIIIRLEHEKTKPSAALAQELFDLMFVKTDETLREMGVGDLGVPRHMKKMMAAFNGRARAYDAALHGAGPETLRNALLNNLYRSDSGAEAQVLSAMADYAKAAFSSLSAQPLEAFLKGDISLPAPGVPAERATHYA